MEERIIISLMMEIFTSPLSMALNHSLYPIPCIPGQERSAPMERRAFISLTAPESNIMSTLFLILSSSSFFSLFRPIITKSMSSLRVSETGKDDKGRPVSFITSKALEIQYLSFLSIFFAASISKDISIS